MDSAQPSLPALKVFISTLPDGLVPWESGISVLGTLLWFGKGPYWSIHQHEQEPPLACIVLAFHRSGALSCPYLIPASCPPAYSGQWVPSCNRQRTTPPTSCYALNMCWTLPSCSMSGSPSWTPIADAGCKGQQGSCLFFNSFRMFLLDSLCNLVVDPHLPTSSPQLCTSNSVTSGV